MTANSPANPKKLRNKTRTKKYPQGKPTVDWSVHWLEFKIKGMEDQYEERSKDYAWMVNQGVGLTSIHALDTLRTLLWLYTDINAHKDALRSLKAELY